MVDAQRGLQSGALSQSEVRVSGVRSEPSGRITNRSGSSSTPVMAKTIHSLSGENDEAKTCLPLALVSCLRSDPSGRTV